MSLRHYSETIQADALAFILTQWAAGITAYETATGKAPATIPDISANFYRIPPTNNKFPYGFLYERGEDISNETTYTEYSTYRLAVEFGDSRNSRTDAIRNALAYRDVLRIIINENPTFGNKFFQVQCTRASGSKFFQFPDTGAFICATTVEFDIQVI
jgi:hypothetical protein